MFVAYIFAASMLVEMMFSSLDAGTDNVLADRFVVNASKELRTDNSALAALDSAVSCSMLWSAWSVSMIFWEAPWSGTKMENVANSTLETVDAACDEIAPMGLEIMDSRYW